jgi:FkbM family methyltransferase
MYLDARDSLDLSLNLVYEPFETELVPSLVHENDTVLDVGANIGYYTLILARLVGPRGRVFSFEPDPGNFALLKKNVEANGYKNVVLVNAALSDQPATLKLYLSEENRGDHRIYPSDDQRRAIQIPAITVDDYFAGLSDEIAFIKMDVQGAEAKVLTGMKRLLEETPKCQMLFEFWPKGISDAGDEAEQALARLTRNRFSLKLVDQQRKSLEPIDAEALLRNFTKANGHQTNVLASKLAGAAFNREHRCCNELR